MSNLIQLEPAGYVDCLCLMTNAGLVLTDSGGIQEETTILGVPCMTLRESTERPVTITEGTNRLVHVTAGDILANYRKIRDGGAGSGHSIPRLWDGKAAQRIAGIIAES
jgi:UDP-N-acetylglucosamine 2-epimerase (non-hydrolysing)